MPNLYRWDHPVSREVRLYVNGLAGQNRKLHKVYLTQATFPTLQEWNLSPDQRAEAAAWVAANFPTWESALRVASPEVAPAPGGISRAMFESAHIAHVAAAARMAGIAFRNGLSKGEIIDRIMNAGASTQASAADYLSRLRSGEKPAPTPTPAPDWLNDPGEDKTPAPAPVAPKAQGSDPMTGDYVTRPQLHDAVRPINASIEALEAGAAETGETLQSLRAKVAELQAQRPLALHFPERPEPVKVQGLTHPKLPHVITMLRVNLHVMLVGPAGAGKTHAAQQAAEALGLAFFMQGAVTYAHELLGYVDAHSRYVRTQFRDAYERGGLILLDEFDASSAEAALVINAALANGLCAFPDGTVRMHADFRCIVGANTDGSGATMQYAGRARLDGAFLDRFSVVEWAVDSRIEDMLAAGAVAWRDAVRAIREFAHQRGILDVVATPRAIKFGATMLQQGIPALDVLSYTCHRGALRECWGDVKALPDVRAFLAGV